MSISVRDALAVQQQLRLHHRTARVRIYVRVTCTHTRAHTDTRVHLCAPPPLAVQQQLRLRHQMRGRRRPVQRGVQQQHVSEID